MICKNCGKNIEPGQKFCPECGAPAQPTENFGETKVFTSKELEELENVYPMEELDDDFPKEIKYEEDVIEDFDFPEEDTDDIGFYDDEEEYEYVVREDSDKEAVTNQNKKMNIIAIAVAVSIIMIIVIVAVVMSKTFGNNQDMDSETTTIEETATLETGTLPPEETTQIREKETERKTEEEKTTKKKKKKPTTTPAATEKKTTAAPTEPEYEETEATQFIDDEDIDDFEE